MLEDTYEQQAMVTDNSTYPEVLERMQKPQVSRMVQASGGMCKEAGEVQDIVSRYIFYGKELDFSKILEELGDLQWFIVLMLKEVNNLTNKNYTLKDIQKLNIAKLRARYNNGGFDAKLAINRNIADENKIISELLKGN